MKRRKAKWPLFLFPLLLVPVALYLQEKRGMKKPREIVEYHPVTWKNFREINRLKMLLKGFAIESIIDVPCVDVNSLDSTLFQGVRYTGITDSKDQARGLQAQFGSSLRTFLSMEITVDILPKADLIFCWDKLCTLSETQALAAITQFKKSGAQFLLMRHYPGVKKNRKNKTGGAQPVNWTIAPYNFPEPIIHIIEKGDHEMESLALWNLEAL